MNNSVVVTVAKRNAPSAFRTNGMVCLGRRIAVVPGLSVCLTLQPPVPAVFGGRDGARRR